MEKGLAQVGCVFGEGVPGLRWYTPGPGLGPDGALGLSLMRASERLVFCPRPIEL